MSQLFPGPALRTGRHSCKQLFPSSCPGNSCQSVPGLPFPAPGPGPSVFCVKGVLSSWSVWGCVCKGSCHLEPQSTAINTRLLPSLGNGLGACKAPREEYLSLSQKRKDERTHHTLPKEVTRGISLFLFLPYQSQKVVSYPNRTLQDPSLSQVV